MPPTKDESVFLHMGIRKRMLSIPSAFYCFACALLLLLHNYCYIHPSIHPAIHPPPVPVCACWKSDDTRLVFHSPTSSSSPSCSCYSCYLTSSFCCYSCLSCPVFTVLSHVFLLFGLVLARLIAC